MKIAVLLSCVSVVVLSGCAGGVTSRQLPVPFQAPALESLREAFASCVSPFGVRGNLPIIGEFAAGEFVGESVELSEPGIVSDGYYHSLVLNRERTAAIIVQTGGLANFTTNYGPFNLNAGCGVQRALSANKSVNADAQSRPAALPRLSLVAGYVRRYMA